MNDSLVHPDHDFLATLRAHGHPRLTRARTTTLQINVGKRCNQACLHCHVDAGPLRTEQMSLDTAERLLHLLANSPDVDTVDITGGAPELAPCFRTLVRGARALGRKVIDRCNLTILSEPGHEDLATFLAEHQVAIIASLPCYGPDNVDQQRGKGVFARSIDGLRLLNDLGYARPNTGLTLDLVYNPLGPSLPPDQSRLEATYKTRLREDFGVEFDHLFTLTNMPISRFLHALRRDGELDDYMGLLAASFNPATVDALMCRHQLSVGYDGRIYDCDFNQMLDLPAPDAPDIFALTSFADLDARPIAIAPHCFGCTAGAGSSCGGALG